MRILRILRILIIVRILRILGILCENSERLRQLAMLGTLITPETSQNPENSEDSSGSKNSKDSEGIRMRRWPSVPERGPREFWESMSMCSTIGPRTVEDATVWPNPGPNSAKFRPNSAVPSAQLSGQSGALASSAGMRRETREASPSPPWRRASRTGTPGRAPRRTWRSACAWPSCGSS